MLSNRSFLSGHPVLVRRFFWLAVVVLCAVATLTLTAATNRSRDMARDAAVQAAWRANAGMTGVPTDPQAVYLRFNIKATTANADLAWQVSSAAQLRASLRSLDAANVNLSQVKVSRNGINYVVSAERAP